MMYPLTPTASVVMGRNHEALARALEQFDGRKYDYVPRNQFEEQYANYPASIVEQIRNQISLGAIKALIIKLGGLREGRKALILVSEGYTNYLPAQLRSPNVSMPGVGNPIAGNEAIRRQHGRAARALLQPGRDALGSEGRLRPGQQEQRLHLRAGPARAGRVRARRQRGRPDHDGRQHAEAHDGLDSRAGGRNRRAGHRQPQRSRRRHAADHPRFERLLSGRLQLEEGAERRQVPQDQGAREAAGRRGTSSQGVLGTHA